MLPDPEDDLSLVDGEGSLTSGGIHQEDSLTLGDDTTVNSGLVTEMTSLTSDNSPGRRRKRPTGIDADSINKESNEAESKGGGKRRGSVLLSQAFSKGAKILPDAVSPSSARRRMSSLVSPMGKGFKLFSNRNDDLGEIDPYMPAIRFRERMDKRYEKAKRRKGEVAEIVGNAGHIKVEFNVERTR